MKSVSDFRMLNAPPSILATRKTIQAIKHIVKIAPEEAQWFHTVEYDSESNSLTLSEELYIPEQVCSAAEVDTSSSMIVRFYKELSAKYDLQTTNSILQAMTCWCHSHHNMAPNPSGQDVRQFSTLIQQSVDQNQSSWQIMLIFNKKDQFYSRVYDPSSGNVYEGIPIDVVEDSFDFSYIDAAAKTKFKTPTPAPTAFANYKFGSPTQVKKIPTDNYNSQIAETIMDQIFTTKDLLLDKFKFSKKEAQTYLANIHQCLTDKEILWFYSVLSGKKDIIIESYSDEIASNKLKELELPLNTFFINLFTSGKFTPDHCKKALKAIFELDDCPTVSELIQKVKLT